MRVKSSYSISYVQLIYSIDLFDRPSLSREWTSYKDNKKSICRERKGKFCLP